MRWCCFVGDQESKINENVFFSSLVLSLRASAPLLQLFIHHRRLSTNTEVEAFNSSGLDPAHELRCSHLIQLHTLKRGKGDRRYAITLCSVAQLVPREF